VHSPLLQTIHKILFFLIQTDTCSAANRLANFDNGGAGDSLTVFQLPRRKLLHRIAIVAPETLSP
jgi:hypothetical protein